jgi:hypothetical protein
MGDGSNPFNNKYVGPAMTAFGVLAMAAAGFVTISTPGEQECQQELTEVKITAGSCQTRVELLTEAKDACKDALTSLTSENR